MEEEFELRPYIELLLKRRYLILGAAMLAAVVAFVVSSLLPPTYEATALVAVTQPRELVQFEPRIRSVEEDEQPLKAYPELAVSDGLLQDLLTELNSTSVDIQTVTKLRRILNAKSGSDPSLIRMSVQYGNPREAAEIANAWADLFVVKANAVFGDQNGTQVQFFEDQLGQSKEQLDLAEQALVAFQSQNRAAIVDNQLNALITTQADYLADQQALVLLIQDVRELHDQLNEQNGPVSVSLADQLTALSLQLKAFNAAFDSETSVPLQLQIGATNDFANATRSEQTASLAALAETLEGRLDQIEDEVVLLEPQILALQKDKQEADTKFNNLIRDKTLAEETYLALARKVDEERISLDEISSGVRLASQATVPEGPTGQKRLFNALVAGVLALIFATIVVVGWEWWHPENQIQDGSQEH